MPGEKPAAGALVTDDALIIDGEHFPWPISSDGARVHHRRLDGRAAVTVTVLVDKVRDQRTAPTLPWWVS